MKVLLLALLLSLPVLVEGRTAFNPSIQPLQDATGRTICTAWSINQQGGLWATAAHCVLAEDGTLGERMLHGKPVVIVFVNPAKDIAVVRSPDRARTLLPGNAPAVGATVWTFGYFLGGPAPTPSKGFIATLSLRGYMMFRMPVGPGHSGSPIFDSKGEVVSILQCMYAQFSCGATYETLTELQPYWGN